jgi:glutamyl-Q tRNA(Asp) synthetase
MTKPIFRFAPSPNGELHLGHAYSALFTWAEAGKADGEVLLRIEDIDVGRCRPEYTEQIFEDLKWLGLDWPEPVRCQHQHFNDYRAAATKLQGEGLLFACFCSRKQLAAAGQACDPDGAVRYPGSCKHLTAEDVAARKATGEPFALRLDMGKVVARIGEVASEFALLADWGDVVLVRKDVPTSYHLSVVVDDGLQGVSHVTRGMDMCAATAIHIALQKLLGLTTPAYHHHQLIESGDGRKLSKSARDQSLKSLRLAGLTGNEIRTMLGF